MSVSKFKFKKYVTVAMFKTMAITLLSTGEQWSELIGKIEIDKIIMGYHR